MPSWDYKTANEFLVDRRKQHGNIAPYTYLDRDGDMIVMRYGVHKRKEHSKELVRLHPDGRVQFRRPWNCTSIRERLNYCAGWHKITNYLGYWTLESKGVEYSFKDGMTLHPDGSVTGHDPEPREDKVKAHKKKIRDRNPLHTVQSIGELSVGDIVFHHRHDFIGYQNIGLTSATTQVLLHPRPPYKPVYKDSIVGPLKIKRLRQSQTRRVIYLVNPDGTPADGYTDVSMSGMNLRKDKFLSAVDTAAKTVA